MSDEVTGTEQSSATAMEPAVSQPAAGAPIAANAPETPTSETKDGAESLALSGNVNMPAAEVSPKTDAGVSETESQVGAQAPLRSGRDSSVPAEEALQKEGVEATKPTKEQKKKYEKLLGKYRTADRFDPTEPFTFSDRLGLKFEEHQIDQWTKILKVERLLVLQSYDWQVLRAAADTIVRALALPSNQQLTFDSQIESGYQKLTADC
jgi:hypothetical protein